MTPVEMEQKIRQLEQRLNQLDAFSSIPFNTEKAFRERLGIDDLTKLQASSKSASSENQSVDESGVATYSVLKPPDGFEQRAVGGDVRYYAFWT